MGDAMSAQKAFQGSVRDQEEGAERNQRGLIDMSSRQVNDDVSQMKKETEKIVGGQTCQHLGRG